jgi:hypothetical protein
MCKRNSDMFLKDPLCKLYAEGHDRFHVGRLDKRDVLVAESVRWSWVAAGWCVSFSPIEVRNGMCVPVE